MRWGETTEKRMEFPRQPQASLKLEPWSGTGWGTSVTVPTAIHSYPHIVACHRYDLIVYQWKRQNREPMHERDARKKLYTTESERASSCKLDV